MTRNRAATNWRPALLLAALMLTRASFVSAQVARDLAPDLAGTSWQLVKFQGSDGTTVRPDDGSKYTITFGADGQLNARIDCNRGRGTWRSPERSRLEFGPLALTRMMCPRESLHDRIVSHWPFVRSYTLRRGHLFLALQADGGIYEFARIDGAPKREAQPAAQRDWYVVLYEKTKYRGDNKNFKSATPDVGLLWSVRVKSVTVGSGTWELCEGEDFKGRCVTLDESVPDLSELEMRAVRSVRPIGGRPPRS